MTQGRAAGDADAFDRAADQLALVGHQHDLVTVLDRERGDEVVAAFIAAALTVLPGFTPKVEASVPMPLAKADRLDLHPAGINCADQTWPNIAPSCLRSDAGQRIKVSAARPVTTDRK